VAAYAAVSDRHAADQHGTRGRGGAAESSRSMITSVATAVADRHGLCGNRFVATCVSQVATPVIGGQLIIHGCAPAYAGMIPAGSVRSRSRLCVPRRGGDLLSQLAATSAGR